MCEVYAFHFSISCCSIDQTLPSHNLELLVTTAMERHHWPLFQESMRNTPILATASCNIVRWSRSSPVVLKRLWAVAPL